MAENEQSCPGDELLWRYIEGSTNDNETRMVRSHLITCEQCFGIFASVLHTEKHALTEAELSQVDQLLNRDREKVIADFLQQNTPAATRSAPRESVWHRMRNWVGERFSARPVTGLAAALVIALVAWQGISFFSQPSSKTGLYIFDDRAPYLPGSLRSSAPATEGPAWRQTLHNAIRNEYVLREYESALQSIEAVESAVAASQADSSDNETRTRLREVYFYKGLSHLALSRSQTRDFPDSVRAAHATQAVRSLELADSLVKAYQLPEPDREAYYLALAFALAGKDQQALAKLEFVDRSSSFFSDSETLKKAWLQK